jgi:hypothetical protein
VTRRLESLDELKALEPYGMMLLFDAALVLNTAGWRPLHRSRRGHGARHLHTRGRAMRDHQTSTPLSQLLLHRVAQGAHQMKAIRDLAGPTANPLGIRAVAIAADC